jgi:hypothetical protein
MNTRVNPQGIIKQSLFFKKAEMDAMCHDALKKGGFLPDKPEPIRIERFVEKYFECTVVYEDMKDGVLGCTAFNANGSVKAVYVSSLLADGSESGRRRTNSTLAHEGGHCLMHPILFIDSGAQAKLNFAAAGQVENLDFRDRRVLCRESDFGGHQEKRYDGRWWEYQANRAIGGFLLPRKLVEVTVTPFLTSVGSLGCQNLTVGGIQKAKAEVAKVFDVNPVVAQIRLQEMYPTSEQAEL